MCFGASFDQQENRVVRNLKAFPPQSISYTRFSAPATSLPPKMATQITNGDGAASVSALNCIDISSSDTLRSVSLLKQACLDCGFFYLLNHGISEEVMAEVFGQSRRLFALPLSAKMELLRNKNYRGYTPYLDQHLDPENQVHGDYKEGYYIGVELQEDDPEAKKPFYGPNVWPAPDVLPGWRETMEEYHRQCLEVAKSVARLVALALDLDIHFFDKPEMLDEAIATVRLLHYDGQVSDPANGIFGAGAHSDFGFVTLLATDDVVGLQICKDKDVKPQIWEYVSPIKGAFIVNIGDMLERWSNSVFKSTLHRVVGNGLDRYSIAFFIEPSHDCLVECLPTCKSEKNPPKFPPILCRTYLNQRYHDTHTDKIVYTEHNS